MGPGGKHSFNDGGQLFPGRPHLASDPLSPLRNGDFAAHHDGQQLLHLLSKASRTKEIHLIGTRTMFSWRR